GTLARQGSSTILFTVAAVPDLHATTRVRDVTPAPRGFYGNLRSERIRGADEQSIWSGGQRTAAVIVRVTEAVAGHGGPVHAIFGAPQIKATESTNNGFWSQITDQAV